MAVTATLLGSLADSVDRTSYTVSITPTADRLLLVYAGYTAPSSPAVPPTLSGNNIATWSLVDDDHATARGLSLHVAKTGAAPSSGNLTLSFSGVTQTHCVVAVIEIDGADLSGTALAAVLQSIDDAQAAVTSRSVSLPSPPGDGSRCFSGWMIEVNEAVGFRANWTELHDAGHASPNRRIEVQWRSDVSEQTGSASWTTSTTVHGIVAEVKLAASTVSLTPASVALSAEAVTPVPQPIAVSLTAASLVLSGIEVTPVPGEIAVDLSPASLTLAAVEVTPEPQPIEVALTAVDIVFTAIELVPTPASSEVSLTAAVLTLEAVATDPQGQPGIVSLTPATLALAGVELEPAPQLITVNLTAVTLTLTAAAVDPDAQPVTISLTAASLTVTGIALNPVPQPITVALSRPTLALTAVSLTATPGLVEMTLTPAVLVLVAVVALQRDANPRHGTYTEPSYTGTFTETGHATYTETAALAYQEP